MTVETKGVRLDGDPPAAPEESSVRNARCADCPFLRNLGHDLRTPLNGIIGNLDLLGTTQLGDDSKIWLQAAMKSAEILNGMLSGMLLEATREELPRQGDWEALLQSMIDIHKPLAWKKGIALEACFAPEIRGIFIFQETRWRRILGNLLANAIKFTTKGGVTLRAFVENRTLPDACDVCLVVEDTGCGISDGDRSRIFHPFYRGSHPEGRPQPGDGLGLSIVKSLLEEMGGRICVESRVDQGTTFCVRANLKRPPPLC